MIVILTSSVFEGGDDVEIVGLIGAGRARRHAIRTSPTFRAEGKEAINRWLGNIGERLEEDRADLEGGAQGA